MSTSKKLSKEKYSDIEKNLYQDDHLSKQRHSLISVSSNVISDNNNIIKNKSPGRVENVKKSNTPSVNSNTYRPSVHGNIMGSHTLDSINQTGNTDNKIYSQGRKLYPDTSRSILRQILEKKIPDTSELKKKTPATSELSKIGDRSTINVSVDSAIRNKSLHAIKMKDKVNFNSEPNKTIELNQTVKLLNYDIIMSSSGLQIKYVCKICNKVFSLKSQINRHLSTHSELKTYVCEKCGKAFKTEACLKGHIHVVHSIKRYECSSCNKEYKSLSVLKTHINKLHKNKNRRTPKTCNLCQKTLSSSECLLRHMRSKHKINGEQYICHDCSAVFNEKSTLTIHIKSKHLPPEYKCSKCSSMFHTVGKLNHHLYKQHMIQKKNSSFICEVCGKVTTSKEKLNNHILTHYDEKQFSCDECGKCFRTSSNLSQHSVVHKNKRPYACYLCDKAFRIRNHLKQHMSVHGMVSTSASNKRKRSDGESNS